jgi:NAD-dependent DNA ligase
MINKLFTKILRCKYYYYKFDESLLEDSIYDKLEIEYKNLFEKNKDKMSDSIRNKHQGLLDMVGFDEKYIKYLTVEKKQMDFFNTVDKN